MTSVIVIPSSSSISLSLPRSRSMPSVDCFLVMVLKSWPRCWHRQPIPLGDIISPSLVIRVRVTVIARARSRNRAIDFFLIFRNQFQKIRNWHQINRFLISETNDFSENHSVLELCSCQPCDILYLVPDDGAWYWICIEVKTKWQKLKE